MNGNGSKKIYSPTSPNAILAYVLRNISTGDPSAKYKEKKNKDQTIVIPTPNLYLFSIILFFLLLDKINYKTIKEL